MAKTLQADIDDLIAAVRASSKYQAVSSDLIRTIGVRELSARRNLKEAIKATKNKLHQVAGAYLDARPPYDKWRELLAAAVDDDRRPTTDDRRPTIDHESLSNSKLKSQNSEPRTQNSKLQQHCREMMADHASTRERLAILDTFYATILARIPPVRSVLDLACGLNPLAISWMPLEQDVSYYACDIYADMIAFLNDFFQLVGVRGQALVCDLLTDPPRQPVDLALVLKVLPPLEQVTANAGRDLLRALNARHMLVSFPARSLGGRDRGMAENYERRFRLLVEAEGWQIERFAFATELAFLVSKETGRQGDGETRR